MSGTGGNQDDDGEPARRSDLLGASEDGRQIRDLALELQLPPVRDNPLRPRRRQKAAEPAAMIGSIEMRPLLAAKATPDKATFAKAPPDKAPPSADGDAPHYHGHRDRLRERFRDAGAGALADYELLELILFRSIPRRDVKPLAKKLLAEFGTFAEVIGASEQRLMRVPEVGRQTAVDIRIIHAAAMRLARGAVLAREVLGSWSQLLEYCRTAMAFEEREHFRILFLDKKNTLIADEVQQSGTVDHTPVYPREVVRRALELSATAVILVHNHPTRPFSITLDHDQAA